MIQPASSATDDQSRSAYVSGLSEPDLSSTSLPNGKQSSAGDTRNRLLSIGWTLPVLVIVPLVFGIGLTGFLAFRNGQRAVSDLAQQLQRSTKSNIESRLTNYLQLPQQLNQINGEALQSELIDAQDLDALGTYFWQQMQAFDVPYLSWTSANGDFVGSGMYRDAALIEIVDSENNPGNLYSYNTSATGERTTLYQANGEGGTAAYDPKAEVSYRAAEQSRRAIWSRDEWDDAPEILVISASQPVYTNAGGLMGVLSVELKLGAISEYLNDLQLPASTRIFIVDNDGLLVANSGSAQSYNLMNGRAVPISPENSADPVIQATARFLNEETDVGLLSSNRVHRFIVEGKQHYVSAFPWQDRAGLNWWVVTVVPRSELMHHVDKTVQHTLLVGGSITAGATLLGILLSLWIVRPIRRLNEAASEIKQDRYQRGELNDIAQRPDELGLLAELFEDMALVVTSRQQSLADQVADLQAEIHEADSIKHTDLDELTEVLQRSQTVRRTIQRQQQQP
ncbi:MAG: cache domain-containing protein [Thainema sp.]